jgi:lipoyl-dependent peroxiredoxin subunit D
MSLESLRNRIPDYAKDIKLNLGNVATSNALTPTQVWGAMLASALAARNAEVVDAIAADAAQHLSPAEQTAVKSAAAIMAMNNIYYRAIHLIEDPDLGKMPARLRMQAIGNPGVDKLDFELWCLAVSAVNGCGMCLVAHAREVAAKGASREAVQDALRIAATVHAAAVVIEGEAALASATQAAA